MSFGGSLDFVGRSGPYIYVWGPLGDISGVLGGVLGVFGVSWEQSRELRAARLDSKSLELKLDCRIQLFGDHLRGTF